MTVLVLSHLMCSSALPEKTKTSDLCIKMTKKLQ